MNKTARTLTALATLAVLSLSNSLWPRVAAPSWSRADVK